MKLENIEPKKVFYYFEKISEIPRESGNEEGISEYIVNFAKERKMEYYKDQFKNVIIKKEASKGLEDKAPLAFQAHMDMICEKTPGSKHDFLKDPLDLYVDGDLIKAKETTLGADNGIGVALILALLDDNTLEMPKIEAIFTVEEETTMIGAIKIDMSKIESKKIISLDNGKEGKILISSAICNEWQVKVKAQKEKIEQDDYTYSLSYKGFLGGHSGGNIADTKRGNPIKLAAEALCKAENLQIIEFNGGSRANVIPREAKIVFSIKQKSQIEKIKKEIEKQLLLYKAFCNETEIILEEDKKETTKFSQKDTAKLLEFLLDYSNGPLERDNNENVILSSCLAKIETVDEGFYIEVSSRCNYKKLKEEYEKKVNKQFEKCNAEIVWCQELKGVEPKENNKLIDLCKKTYLELYAKQMEEIVSQGTVEGGFFLDKKPDCEYTCVGPNSYDVHSPKERLSIESVQRTYKFLKKIIKNYQ